MEVTGNNELRLNEATMRDIVEYWLTNKLLNKDEPTPKVAGVTFENSGRYEATFVVKLETLERVAT